MKMHNSNKRATLDNSFKNPLYNLENLEKQSISDGDSIKMNNNYNTVTHKNFNQASNNCWNKPIPKRTKKFQASKVKNTSSNIQMDRRNSLSSPYSINTNKSRYYKQKHQNASTYMRKEPSQLISDANEIHKEYYGSIYQQSQQNERTKSIVQNFENIAQLADVQNVNLRKQNEYLLKKLKEAKQKQVKIMKIYDKARNYRKSYQQAIERIQIAKQQSCIYQQQMKQLQDITEIGLKQIKAKFPKNKSKWCEKEEANLNDVENNKNLSASLMSTEKSSNFNSLNRQSSLFQLIANNQKRKNMYSNEIQIQTKDAQQKDEQQNNSEENEEAITFVNWSGN